MSKTYTKVVNAVHALLHAVPVTAESFRLDIAKFRSANKLGSEPKGLLVKHIQEALIRDDANKGDDSLGVWVMGEVTHPVYQFSRLNVFSEMHYTDNRPHFVTVGNSGKLVEPEAESPQSAQDFMFKVEQLIVARAEAKCEENNKVFDSITEQLTGMGVALADSADGTTWTVTETSAHGGKVGTRIDEIRKKVWTWSPTQATQLKSAFTKEEIACLLENGLLNEAGEMAAPTIKALRAMAKFQVKKAPTKKVAPIKKSKPGSKAKKDTKRSRSVDHPTNQPVDSSIPPGASVAQHYGIGN